MQNSIPKPRLLDEWLKLLDNTRLPVPTGDKQRVSTVLNNDKKNISDIAQVISSSPSIALILFREANKQKSIFNRPAQHMEAVLTRLGINRCKELLSKLKDTPEQDIPKGIRQLWLISGHANAQANALFAVKLARVWQDIHWSSLLFLAPLWPLITRYPNLFNLWEQRVLDARESQTKVEHELFGASLNKLCQALAKYWSLPDWVIHAYDTINDNQQQLARTLQLARLHDQPLLQRQLLDEQKDIYMWFRQPANSIFLANGLAIGAHHSWSSERCLRWQRYASLFLEEPLDQIQNKIHQNAVNHAQKIGRTLLWHPAQMLLWPTGSNRICAPELICNQTKAVTADLQQWQQQAKLMLQQPSPFANHSQLLEALRKLLHLAGLARCAIISINHKTDKLQPIYQSGFKFTLHQPMTKGSRTELVQKIILNNQPVLIQPQNLGKFKELLTQEFSSAVTSSNFLLGKIQLGNRPVMLLIADNYDQKLDINQCKGFAASSRYFEQALTVISKKS